MTESDNATVDFYWRPGCGFCTMLDRSLTQAGIPLTKHNIWDDADAADIVRGYANGTETVPTVVVDEVGLVNPTRDMVIELVTTRCRSVLPDDWEPPTPGPIGSAVKRLFG